jgi:hypothetical protein
VVSIDMMINKKGSPRCLQPEHLALSLYSFNVGTIGTLKQTRADGSVDTVTRQQTERPTNPGSVFSKGRRFV